MNTPAATLERAAAAAVTSPPAAGDYRCERKFLIEGLALAQVRAIVKLHPALFREAYPPRFVNNIYLDTVELDCYRDNLAGLSDRVKVRVRWYGDLFGTVARPVLEYKIKHGLAGTKVQYPLAPLTVGPGFAPACLIAAVRAAPGLPGEVRESLAPLRVALINRYQRAYFASWDGALRLTIDAQLGFYNADRLCNSFLQRHATGGQIVVELKYRPEDEGPAGRAAAGFPFRPTRSSKYVQGIARVLY